MLKYEFEQISGYEVSDDDYNKYIEPMYMALPDGITKQEFVKMISKKHFALPTKQQMKKKMREIAKHLYEICGRYTDWKSMDELMKLARKYAKLFHNLDWGNDMECFVYTHDEYEFPEIKRGCTQPKTLVIGKGNTVYEEIELVKGDM